MTNPLHAERALAYDVPVGVCNIKSDALRKLRVMADWRLLKSLNKTKSAKVFEEYFEGGKLHQLTVAQWAQQKGGGGERPASIIDSRENPAPGPLPNSGEMAFG